MKKTLAIVMVSLITTSMAPILLSQVKADYSIPPEIEWSRTYGGAGGDQANSVVQTDDGGYALAGTTYSSGAGETDFWLVKTYSNGDMEWSQTYGGTGREYGQSVIQTLDGGYAITGCTRSFGAGSSDFWLVKTDSVGNLQWSKTYGGLYQDEAYCVVQTSDGGYAISGYTYSSGAGGFDFWLVKTHSNGNMEWDQTYGGDDNDFGWSVVQTDDGGYALAGTTYSSGAGETDFWLVKTYSNGDMEWSQTYGGTDHDWGWSMVQTDDGGYALAGYTWSFGAGENDYWLVKTDADGDMEWSQTYGGTDHDSGKAVIQTGDGGYALAGFTASSGAGGWDSWLIKLSSEAPPPVEEMTFFPPYQEGPCGKLSWDMWNAFAECDYSTDTIGGIGHIEMDNWALIGLGKAYSTVYFSLKTSWTSGSTGTARIAAAFNVDGFMRTIGASASLLFPGSGLATATLNASISIRDVTTEQEIGRKEKIIFREEVSWRDIILPFPSGKTEYYDNAGYTIHDNVDLQKDHEYTWTFSIEMEGQVASVAWAAAFAQGDITATLSQVWIEPPDPWTPPPEEPPTPEDMMYIGASCPVTLLVTDPAGRQIGFDPFLQVEVNEIPNAWYSSGSEAQLISIPQPIHGDYKVEVYGTDIGDYTLIALVSENGVLLNTFDFGGIVEDAVHVYSIGFTEEALILSPNPLAELQHLKEFIGELLDDAFDKPRLAGQRKNVLFNKFDEIILKVGASNYTDAINKLLHDIRAKMDGDSTAEDWIVDPETRPSLCVIIDHIIFSIEALQQE